MSTVAELLQQKPQGRQDVDLELAGAGSYGPLEASPAPDNDGTLTLIAGGLEMEGEIIGVQGPVIALQDESSVTIEITDKGSGSLQFSLTNDAFGLIALFVVNDSGLLAFSDPGNAGGDSGPFLLDEFHGSWDSVEERWLRFRLSGGMLLWESSPDGTSWTTLSQVDMPEDVSLSDLSPQVRWQGVTGTDAITLRTYQATSDGPGVPIGLGDWRLATQILLPADITARWGIATWGESNWNGLAWYDISDYVRGMEWFRGSEEVGARPEVGVAEITLDNHDRKFSPWNGVSAYQRATVVTDTNQVLPGYLAPGTIMRIVAHSPTGQIAPITDPPVPAAEVTFFDDFDVYDAGDWWEFTDATVSGGTLSLDGSNYFAQAGYFEEWPTAGGLTVTWKLQSTPTTAYGALYTQGSPGYFEFYYDGADWYDQDYTVFTPEGLWFRNRYDSGTLYQETSADGVTWVTQYTDTYSDGDVEVYADVYDLGEMVVDSIQVDYIEPASGTLNPDSDDSWVPMFTGVVESWQDSTDGVGSEAFVDVTVVETMGALAKIDENALGSVVGNDDSPAERFERLVDLSDWRYGIRDTASWTYGGLAASDLYLQSTDLSLNRIAEFYLTADSTLLTVRTDRSGMITYYPPPQHGEFGPADRGPDIDQINCLNDDALLFAGVIYVPYVADSVQIKNDDEPIINHIDYAYSGSLVVRTDSDNVSIEQYGKRAVSRYDFITKSNDVLDLKIEKELEGRARTPLRLHKVSLHSAHEYALVAIIGLDIDNRVPVFIPGPTTGTTIVDRLNVSSLTHRVTPLNGSEVLWTTDITFGSLAGAFFTN